MTSGVEVLGFETQILPPPPLPPPARALTTRVLSLNAGMILPRMAPTHQRQGPPGALTAPPGGLQHLPDECPQQAAPSIPAPYGHLTLTRTAPGPDSSGQGWGWGGRGAGDLPLSPALPAQGTWGNALLPPPGRKAARREGAATGQGSLGEPIEQPLPSWNPWLCPRFPFPLRVSLAS